MPRWEVTEKDVDGNFFPIIVESELETYIRIGVPIR